ncbi:hypothetical protein MNBD_PLANCTO02-2351 [hydrothermal vent metagenome]|uniref:STAS domain-containing protein n=1 Tax=hydrothermal vent metagenome TaxID=652676 RepID=A0A3B1DME1_9ZZZZ
MPARKNLEVYQSGKLTVIGFGNKEVLDHINPTECRDEIIALINQHRCKVLAFDLTGVIVVPSGLLGLLASLRQLNTKVLLFNPSEDVRDVLEITKLDRVMQICEVNIPMAS